MLEFSILIVSIIIFIILTNQNSRHTMTYLDTLKLNSIEYGARNTIISQFNTIKL